MLTADELRAQDKTDPKLNDSITFKINVVNSSRQWQFMISICHSSMLSDIRQLKSDNY